MPDWLIIYIPLIVFVILLPPILMYNYRRYHRKKEGKDAPGIDT